MNCKYNLENLTTNRCPECGREFDPNDLTTFDPQHIHRLRPLQRFLAAGGILYLMLFIFLSVVDLSAHRPPQQSFAVAAALAAFLWILVMLISIPTLCIMWVMRKNTH
ncbi:MAG TPA: hypothetical protein VG711_07705 [Phycisphaerales bacterium]|nr:hypothetical protein [Phycisphaerales bacterium]